jgi:hypothetical protein
MNSVLALVMYCAAHDHVAVLEISFNAFQCEAPPRII